MKFSDIHYESFCDGDGVRVVLFVSGCEHHCEGCHNAKTWDPENGYEFTEDTYELLKDKLKKPYITGLTLSGGDPFLNAEHSFNMLMGLDFKNLWIYTGYTFEELLERAKDDIWTMLLIHAANVIVDGRYMKCMRDLSLPFKGSSNQRIIDVHKSLEENKIVLYM